MALEVVGRVFEGYLKKFGGPLKELGRASEGIERAIKEDGLGRGN